MIIFLPPLLLGVSFFVSVIAFASSAVNLLQGRGDPLQVVHRSAWCSALATVVLYLSGCVRYYGGLGSNLVCAHDGIVDERLIGSSLIPLSTTCARGTEMVEIVPRWLNPAILALSLVFVASLSAWVHMDRARRRP